MDLIEIKGKINTAICYARVVEDEAIEQIRRMCDYPMTEGSRIRIMPDVHSGKGCTIGTTMTITDKAVPNVVGVDIGCGMYTVNLGKVDIDFVKVDEAAHFIPSGMNVWEGRQERFDLTELACYRELKDTKRLERSLGTLGGGNHFIEIDEAGDGTKYLVIHSGSRNLGKQVAELYQKLAINLDRGYGDYLEKRDEIIRTYKEQGRRSEIQDALKQLHWQVYESETSMPEDLCYLSGKYLEDYLHDVEICQAFARRSREKMAEIILERTGMAGREAFHTIHNYIDTDEMIEEMKLYPYMSGLTISGGEPFSQKTAILRLIFDFKTLYPNKNIVVFSGYRMEELIEMNDLEVKQILDTIDYLIDGRFDLKLKDISLVYRGSSNQRIIDMKKTKQAGKIIIKEF